MLGSGRRQLEVKASSQEEEKSSLADEVSSVSSEDQYGLEPCEDWIRRTTRHVERELENAKLEDWCTQLRRRKWRWFAKVMGADDCRWTYSALRWDPASNRDAGRSQGRPTTRWVDDIIKFLQMTYDCSGDLLEDWQFAALENHIWDQLEEDYVRHGI